MIVSFPRKQLQGDKGWRGSGLGRREFEFLALNQVLEWVMCSHLVLKRSVLASLIRLTGLF